MPRPFVEATALLASHGHITPPEIRIDLYRRKPRMPDTVRFAIIRAEPAAKPLAFADLDALARHIQRERGIQGLDLVETEDLEVEGDPEPRRAVQIYTLDAGNDRDRNLGCAWLDGQGLEVLKSALRRNRLVVTEDREAA